jgi:hypothetical protein
MGQTQPPPVAADPTHAHLVDDWTVHATAAGMPFEIRGTLSWIGKPGNQLSGFTWLILAGGNLPFVAVLVVLTLRQRRRKAARPPGAPTAVVPPTADPPTEVTPPPMVTADRPHG